MPNHIHLLIFIYESAEDINKIIGESKRFLAYKIVSKLKRMNKIELLTHLTKGVQRNERKKNKKHQVFRLSSDFRLIEGEDSVVNVLNYIHHNPVQGKWNLVDDFVDYRYSSATFYELERLSEFEITHFRDIQIVET